MNIIILFAGTAGDDFIMMQDNALSHAARVCKDYLNRETIEGLDLNPIEHVWDIFYRRISQRDHQ